MRSLLLIFLLWLTHTFALNVTDGGTRGLPGAKLHLTEKGIQYLGNVAGQGLNAVINANKRLPDLSRRFDQWWGEGSLSARNIEISAFHSPAFEFMNGPADRITFKSSGGYAKVAGEWTFNYQKMFVNVSRSGVFTCESLEVPRFEVSARFLKTTDGKIAASDIRCAAEFGRFSLDNNRGKISRTLLKFSTPIIINYMRPALERRLCDEAKQYANNIVNTYVGRHPFYFEFWPNLLADFRLTRDLLIGDNSVESWHTDWAVHKKWPNDPIPFFPHPLQMSGDHSKMLYALGSDYLFNSVFYQAHRFNISYFETDEKTSKVALFLRPSCHVFCLGTIFPQLEEMFGRTAKGHLTAYTTRAPTVMFKSGKATINGQGYMEVYAMQAVNKTKMFGVLGTLEADMQFKMVNKEGAHPRLVFNVSINSVQLDQLDSDIDAIKNGSEEIIEQFMNFSREFAEELANEQLESGVKIQFAADATLKDARIKVLDRTIEIATDLVVSHGDTVFEYGKP